MLRFTANFFSVIFHPLFLPVYALLFVNWASPYQLAGTSVTKLLPIIIFSSTLLPLITIFLMKKLGMVKSVFLREREERIIPLAATGMFYFWSFMVIRKLELSALVTALFLGASIAVFVCFFFNLFFKISAHAAAAGAFAAMAFFLAAVSSYNLEIPLVFILIFAGVVGSSRWYLSEHNGMEIFSGYLAGFLSQAVAFRIML